MKLKNIIKPIAFIVIFFMLFSYFSELMSRKTTVGAWNHTQKISGFYNEPDNEFDIMFFGSSNTYCSFNPLIIYKDSGIKSYVFASQQQPVWATYAYMKEALKTQKPELLVVDVLMFTKPDQYYDDGVNYSYMDDIPFSKNKIELAWASASTNSERFRLLVNFIKYHSRWSELTEDDYKFKRNETTDYLKGYVLLEETFTDAKFPEFDTTETSPLGEKQIEYFYKIISLSKEYNIPLLFVKTPSNIIREDQKLVNTVRNMASEKEIHFIDFNSCYDEIGFEMSSDFYDKSHLNYKGAEKFSAYFAEKIISLYPELSDKEINDERWIDGITQYREYINNLH